MADARRQYRRRAKAAAATVVATALLWLLLNATGHSAQQGFLSDVT